MWPPTGQCGHCGAPVPGPWQRAEELSLVLTPLFQQPGSAQDFHNYPCSPDPFPQEHPTSKGSLLPLQVPWGTHVPHFRTQCATSSLSLSTQAAPAQRPDGRHYTQPGPEGKAGLHLTSPLSSSILYAPSVPPTRTNLTPVSAATALSQNAVQWS